MAGKVWTEKEEKVLRDLAGLGYSIDEIRIVLKSRSRDAIFSKATSLRISLSGPEPQIDMDEFKRLMKRGK